jgi:hypothetical protein
MESLLYRADALQRKSSRIRCGIAGILDHPVPGKQSPELIAGFGGQMRRNHFGERTLYDASENTVFRRINAISVMCRRTLRCFAPA